MIAVAVMALAATGVSVASASAEQTPTGTVSGHISDSQGNPLVGTLQVSVFDSEQNPCQPSLYCGGVESSVVAADGSYTINRVPAGSYRVEAYSAGFTWHGPDDPLYYLPMFYPNSQSFSGAETLEVADGQQLSGIDLVLERAGSVTGTVTSWRSEQFSWPQGPGPRGPTVYAYAVSGYPSEFSRGVVYGTTAGYRIDGLPAGEYRIVFRDDTYEAPFPPTWYRNSPTEQGAVLVTVANGATTSGIDLAVSSTGPPPPPPVTPTPVRLAQSVSGRVPARLKKRASVKLPARTSAGSPLRWRSKTPRRCTVAKSGRLLAKRTGKCTVVGSAPATTRATALTLTRTIAIHR
jgi:hypothetical protein